MNTKTTNPPKITQHSKHFRLFAIVSGKVLLLILIGYFTINKKPRLPRARALITYNDNILLIKNVTDSNQWTLPGGGLKKSESYDMAVAREIREELNIRSNPDLFNLIKHYSKSELGQSFDKVCFLLDLSEFDELNIKPSIEILEARWFSIDNLPINTSIVVKKIINDYLQGY
jgi:8-oxo-dGTP pyrophosphatase MutT (NUDIX family)